MKIKLLPDNKVYAGTPSDIVNKLRRDAIFMKTASIEDYMEKVLKRLSDEGRDVIKLAGENLEERCESFLAGMVASRQAALSINKADLDQYVIGVLRRAVGLSQEALAAKIGVSFASVNRWERGLHMPRMDAVVENLRRVASELIEV
jgi:DNA-binding transcriptional regulator YiaG